MSIHARLLRVAYGVAAASPDASTQVGAALLSGGRILSASNAPSGGISPNHPALARRPAKYLYTAHAEEALVARAAREGLACDGAWVAVTHEPCAACARLLVGAGFAGLVLHTRPADMGWDKDELAAAREILSAGGVEVVRADPGPVSALLVRGVPVVAGEEAEAGLPPAP